jgi:hypothetical protein
MLQNLDIPTQKLVELVMKRSTSMVERNSGVSSPIANNVKIQRLDV